MPSRIGSGWKAALPDLQGPERRLWVSAYIAEQHLNEVRRGDRVLLRGLARDFAYGASRLDAVRTLLQRGISVRTHRLLHAKVYMRESNPSPIAWIGSANLSSRGISEGGSGENLEAMSGPVFLEPEEMVRLERWWDEAEPLTLDRLEALAAEARTVMNDDAIARLVQAAGGILALQVSFSRAAGSFTLPADWFVAPVGPVKRAWRGVGVSVPYATSDAEAEREVAWRDARKAILDGLRDGVAEPIPHSRHRFVVDFRYRSSLDDVLPRINEMLVPLGTVTRQGAGADDFVERARTVVQAQAEARGLADSWRDVEAELRQAYGEYEAVRVPTVAFGFSVPIGPQGLAFERAVERLRSGPPSLFVKEPRQQVEQLVSRLEGVIAQHGRGSGAP